MSNIQRCPQCNLINVTTAMVCDCGYDFQSKTCGQSLLHSSPQHALGAPSTITNVVEPVLSSVLSILWVIIWMGGIASFSTRLVCNQFGGCLDQQETVSHLFSAALHSFSQGPSLYFPLLPFLFFAFCLTVSYSRAR